MTVSIVSCFDQEELILQRLEEGKKEASCDNDVSEELAAHDPLAFAIRPVKRSVRFSADPVSHVHEIEHVNDFTDEEIEKAWFSNQEFREIRFRYNVTARIMSTACKVDENEHCGRGLERKTEEGARKREICKLASIGAVLREQHRQQILGGNDPLAIARAYISETHKAKEFARELGVADEIEVDHSRLCILVSNTAAKTSKDSNMKKLVFEAGNRRRAVLEDLIAVTVCPVGLDTARSA